MNVLKIILNNTGGIKKIIKKHKNIFNDVLEYYEDLDFNGINKDDNVSKLKQQLKAVETKRLRSTYNKAYHLAECGEYLVSNYDMKHFLLDNGYKNINDDNVFKKYCHVIAISIRNGLNQLDNERS